MVHNLRLQPGGGGGGVKKVRKFVNESLSKCKLGGRGVKKDSKFVNVVCERPLGLKFKLEFWDGNTKIRYSDSYPKNQSKISVDDA